MNKGQKETTKHNPDFFKNIESEERRRKHLAFAAFLMDVQKGKQALGVGVNMRKGGDELLANKQA